MPAFGSKAKPKKRNPPPTVRGAEKQNFHNVKKPTRDMHATKYLDAPDKDEYTE
jgi:hypothetical protein